MDFVFHAQCLWPCKTLLLFLEPFDIQLACVAVIVTAVSALTNKMLLFQYWNAVTRATCNNPFSFIMRSLYHSGHPSVSRLQYRHGIIRSEKHNSQKCAHWNVKLSYWAIWSVNKRIGLLQCFTDPACVNNYDQNSYLHAILDLRFNFKENLFHIKGN